MEPHTTTRIDLPLASLSKRKVDDLKECYLQLFPTHMQYKIVGTYRSTDNEEAIEKEYTSNYRWTRKKASLVNVDMYYDNIESMWAVSIEFSGIGPSTEWHYTSPKEALRVYTQLAEYLIT